MIVLLNFSHHNVPNIVVFTEKRETQLWRGASNLNVMIAYWPWLMIWLYAPNYEAIAFYVKQTYKIIASPNTI